MWMSEEWYVIWTDAGAVSERGEQEMDFGGTQLVEKISGGISARIRSNRSWNSLAADSAVAAPMMSRLLLPQRLPYPKAMSASSAIRCRQMRERRLVSMGSPMVETRPVAN